MFRVGCESVGEFMTLEVCPHREKSDTPPTEISCRNRFCLCKPPRRAA